MTTNKLTAEEHKSAFRECDCGKGIHLRQGQFSCPLHHCGLCRKWVAEKEMFQKFQVAIELMSK